MENKKLENEFRVFSIDDINVKKDKEEMEDEDELIFDEKKIAEGIYFKKGTLNLESQMEYQEKKFDPSSYGGVDGIEKGNICLKKIFFFFLLKFFFLL